MEADFWASFWPGLAASLVSGTVLLGVAYWFIDNRLHLRARGERTEEEERARQRNKEAVLRVVLSELTSNAAQVTTALAEMPKGGILYPLFDLSMWPLIADTAIFPTLENETVTALTHAYNRMATANEQNAFLSDLNHGQTAILTSAAVVSEIINPRVKEQYDNFRAYRDETVKPGVIERVRDLKPFLDNAIDAVEKELGMTPEVPAVQRVFQPETPVGFVGDEKSLPPPPE